MDELFIFDIIEFLLIAVVIFWMFFPSDNPKTVRFNIQKLMRKDPIWKFLFYLILIMGIIALFL